MDIKKYISSGILEQYVLGMTTEAERLEVEKYAQEFPEIRKEIDAIEVAMEQYAMMHELPKPDGVEVKFNKQIDDLVSKDPSSNSNNIDKKPGGLWLPILLTAALLTSGWWGFSNYKSYQKSESDLGTVTNELNTLQENCDETSQENETLKQRLEILQNPDNQVITMKKDQILASVIWNPETQKSYLFNTNQLPAPPAGKVYQLWAIVDGTPTDMGPFRISADENDLREVPFFENPTAFAITLENGPNGSPTPTLSDLVVIQNI